MALPDLINRLFSFTGFQQGQGDNTFPGTNIDADLDQTNNAVNGLRAGLATLLRPDGKLANGVVGRGSLSADVLLGVGPSKPWSAGQSYRANVDTVTRANKVYLAVFNSVGVDPLSDTTGAYWLQTADLSQAVVVADGSIGTSAFADRGVTEPKLADGAVSSRTLGAGIVARGNVALSLGVVPVGTVTDYAGAFPIPAGWFLCAGQNIPRAYTDLFQAITVGLQVTLTAGSSALGDPSAPLSGLGLRGAVIEGPGVPAGTFLAGDATGAASMTRAATANGRFTVRMFPYGNGDGSTTFNVPDLRGRAVFGRDDMGGPAVGRIATAFDGANLATSANYSTGGRESATLSNVNLPVTLPGGSVTVSYPPHQYVRYSDLTTVSAGAGGTPIGNIWHDVSGQNTVAPSSQSFGFGISNPGGGNAFSIVPPAAVLNKLIFAGA